MKPKTYVCCEKECGSLFRVTEEKQPWKPQPQPEQEVLFCPFCGYDNVMEQED